MIQAPSLFDDPDQATIEAQFWEFHAGNPHVYELLVRFARDAKSRGARLGIRAIWERMRWELFFTTTEENWKLNDHYTSRYARLIMAREPDLAEFFEVRKLRAE